jgi:carboxymethylenebutenolidase
VNYGRVPPRRERLRGVCPVVASYGGRDLTTRADPPRLRAHLEALEVTHDVKVYPSSGHSFMSPGSELRRTAHVLVPMRIGYQHDDAEDAWRRTLAFFDTHLRRSRFDDR